MTAAERFQVRIPSDTSAGQPLQERVVKLLEDLHYPDRDVFGVRLALEEALVNAIKHGNRENPRKHVRVRCEVDEHHVLIEIEDEGRGFLPENVPDPTTAENLERPNGRGIMLMRNFMNRIEYNATGNRVLLEKFRGPDDD
jgi:serine/threonine-protein kinase RsbW